MLLTVTTRESKDRACRRRSEAVPGRSYWETHVVGEGIIAFYLNLFLRPAVERVPNTAVKPSGRWVNKILGETPQIIIALLYILKWVSLSSRLTHYHLPMLHIFCHEQHSPANTQALSLARGLCIQQSDDLRMLQQPIYSSPE